MLKRVKFHKSLFWVPILEAGGPYWVLISQNVGSLFQSLGFPISFCESVPPLWLDLNRDLLSRVLNLAFPSEVEPTHCFAACWYIPDGLNVLWPLFPRKLHLNQMRIRPHCSKCWKDASWILRCKIVCFIIEFLRKHRSILFGNVVLHSPLVCQRGSCPGARPPCSEIINLQTSTLGDATSWDLKQCGSTERVRCLPPCVHPFQDLVR